VKPFDQNQKVMTLIARSSLGTRRALVVRAQTPRDVTDEIVRHAENRRVFPAPFAPISVKKNNGDNGK